MKQWTKVKGIEGLYRYLNGTYYARLSKPKMNLHIPTHKQARRSPQRSYRTKAREGCTSPGKGRSASTFTNLGRNCPRLP